MNQDEKKMPLEQQKEIDWGRLTTQQQIDEEIAFSKEEKEPVIDWTKLHLSETQDAWIPPQEREYPVDWTKLTRESE